MKGSCDIMIVGAGPYGLSIAAHLRERGLDFRIMGSPMRSWSANVPKGMLLKSAGFASNLYAPGGAFRLEEYCRQRGIEYRDIDFPIPAETFFAYGIAFQQRFAPDLLREKLVMLERRSKGFDLHLDGGGRIRAATVILAVGLDSFRNVPEVLQHLPPGSWTHSADHHELGRFRGKDVAVIGGGASATDLSVLLHEEGARVLLVARKMALDFGERWANPTTSSLWRRIRRPVSGIGPGWSSLLYAKLPMLYRYLPDHRRLRIANSFLGPSGGWFMQERAAQVPALMGHSVVQAHAAGDKVALRLAGPAGATRDVPVDHVIAATGYKAEVGRLPFLSQEIVGEIQRIGQAPRLSPSFESSVPGLYFVGPVSMVTFGPVMRFSVGAAFTAGRIAEHLGRRFRPRRDSVPAEPGSFAGSGQPK